MVLVIHYSDVIIDAIARSECLRGGGPKIIVTPLAETYVGSELRHHCCCCSRDRQTDTIPTLSAFRHGSAKV